MRSEDNETKCQPPSDVLVGCLGTHAGCIASLLRSNSLISVKGFKKAVTDSLWRYQDEYRPVDAEALDDWQSSVTLIPDAFLINGQKRTVVCYEIEVGNPLNESKLRRYVDAWWLLDYQYWDLQLISYDGYGNPRDIDLLEIERALIARRMIDDKASFVLRDRSTW